MSILEARELLGDGGENLSDQQIQQLINLLDSFTKLIIDKIDFDK